MGAEKTPWLRRRLSREPGDAREARLTLCLFFEAAANSVHFEADNRVFPSLDGLASRLKALSFV